MSVIAHHPLSHPSVVDRITRLEQQRDDALLQASINGETAKAQAKELSDLRRIAENTVVEVQPWNKDTCGLMSVTIWTLIEEPEIYGRPKCKNPHHSEDCEGCA